MFFGNNKQYNYFTTDNYKLKSDNIELVEEYEYLSIILDKKLNFNFHAETLCKKKLQKVGIYV